MKTACQPLEFKRIRLAGVDFGRKTGLGRGC